MTQIKKYINVINSLAVALLLSEAIAAQQVSPAVDKVAAQYFASVGDKALIFTGQEPQPYTRIDERESSDAKRAYHPFYVSPAYANGSAVFNNVVYNDIALRYDLLRDELTVRDPRQVSILLEPAKVQEATVNGARLIAYDADEWQGIPACNYLIMMYDGKYPVVKKIMLAYHSDVSTHGVDAYYMVSERLYIRRDGYCYPAGNKRALLRCFPDRRKEINTFIKQQKLRFGTGYDSSIIAVAKYLETLP